MWFRRKNRKKDAVPETAASDKAAMMISGLLLRTQSHFARTMNKTFGRLGKIKLKVLLYLFCLTWGGYSLFLMLKFLKNNSEDKSIIEKSDITVPKHMEDAGDVTSDHLFNTDKINNLIVFINYMDSLKLSHSKMYDSIMIAQPGLLDSCRQMAAHLNSKTLKPINDE